MIVSNFAPRTTLTFNIHAEASRKPGEAWGTWTVNRVVPRGPTPARAASPELKPKLDDHDIKYTCKVSTVSASPQ